MSDFQYDLPSLENHTGTVNAQMQAVKTASAGLASTGAGSQEMYGLLVGQIAFPILSNCAQGAEETISSLASLLESVHAGLGSTVQAYQQTEKDHIDRTQQIVSELNSIGE